jgi:peptidoglycan/LPS O-acetylase OafA/YrhL
MFGILRTLLAINVVLLHIFNVPTLGNYSVSFFFLLSGFLMTLIMHESYGYTKNGFGAFWINRWLRLYPTYFFIISITIIVLIILPTVVKHKHLYMPESFGSWVYNLTMLYPNMVPHRIEPRLVPPSWALTNELVFYLLISFGISKSLFRTLIWFAISVIYYLITYYFYNIETYRYSAILASSLPFSLGALLFYIKDYKLFIKPSLLLVVIFYALFILNAVYSHHILGSLKDLSIYINLLFAFVLVYLLFNFQSSKRYRFIDTYIGFYSYPIYLSHYVVAMLYAGIIGFGTIQGSFKLGPLAMLPYFILLMSFCAVVVHLIDRNIDRIKSRIKKKRL